MSRAKQIQLGFIGFALLYTIIGNYSWVAWQTEYFPIYSWDLFSYVPSHTAEFAVRILAIDNAALEPPLYFNEATRYIPAAQSIEAFSLIQRFGNAIYTGNGDSTDLRTQFEALYLDQFDGITYEMVIRTYDSIDYAQSGLIEDVIPLQKFEK